MPFTITYACLGPIFYTIFYIDKHTHTAQFRYMHAQDSILEVNVETIYTDC